MWGTQLKTWRSTTQNLKLTMKCVINYFLTHISTIKINPIEAAYWTKPRSQWKYSLWASLTYFRKSGRGRRLKFALFQWPEMHNIEWFTLLFLGVLSEQKILVPAHNSKLTSLKGPCDKKNAGSYPTQQVTSFWTCALWSVYTHQFPISDQVSVCCYPWKTNGTILLSEMPNGSIRPSVCVVSWHLA